MAPIVNVPPARDPRFSRLQRPPRLRVPLCEEDPHGPGRARHQRGAGAGRAVDLRDVREGHFGLVTISRSLEERRVPTRLGRPQWNRNHIKAMLKNETYAGTRYFNRITAATDASRDGKQVIRGRWVYRDRGERIRSPCPPSFRGSCSTRCMRSCAGTSSDTAGPSPTTSCRAWSNAACAAADVPLRAATTRSSARRGRLSVYHRAMYRCNRHAQENMHDRMRIERCRNSEIGTYILEGKVFEMI